MASKKTTTKKAASPTKSPITKKKKTVPKKAIVKKAAKKNTSDTALRSLPDEIAGSSAGVPCICIPKRNRWYCMKVDPSDGSLVRCDGPFTTKEECEEHVCLEE